MVENGTFTQAEFDAVKKEIDDEIARAVQFALESEPLDPSQTVVDVYTDIVEEVR